MEIKQVAKNILDVFTGQGWLNWSRFHVKYHEGKAYPKLIKGQPLNKEDFDDLCKQLANKS